MKITSLDEFMCQNSGLWVTFQWPSDDFAGCISQRGVKVRRTARLKCDKMRVRCEFDKVRGSSHGTTLVHAHFYLRALILLPLTAAVLPAHWHATIALEVDT
eukprot:1160121-Pelagomonas_calceolata.AAC.4